MQRLQQMLHRMLGGTRPSLENEAWKRNMLREASEHDKQLKTPLSALKVAGIDSETTGFSPEHGDEIISLAAARWSGGTADEPFHSYVSIQADIPHMVSKLTGITLEHLHQAPSLEKVIPEFFNYIGSSVLLGYFVGHDIKFINYFLWKKHRTRITHRVLDLYGIMPLLDSNLEHANFDEACQHYGVVNSGRHTALGDALAVIDLWNHIVRDLEHQEIVTLEHLYQKLAKNRNTNKT
ncbi:exonuclease domain-containing protein [Ammoniphilus sp. YIM 78166]|uniref:exonuclease domain-containing protein n=1 Tax=Ammoniphilus sp. YIM 78166 TaxID=1644106 RepID=UPI00143094EF|nr:exonuclease domain-containing protein [Ammoniphilus sp. YIM 78166]